jgi:hypothetical protein
MRWIALGLLVSTAAGCDGRPIEIDPDRPGDGDVLAVLLGDGRECPASLPVIQADEALRVENPTYQRLTIVEVSFVESCRAMPGQYALARDTVGSRTYWFGTDGCRMWQQPPAPNGSYGVIRVQQTAALFAPPTGSCVSFPGESTLVRSDSISHALVVVKSKDAAVRLVERLGKAK